MTLAAVKKELKQGKEKKIYYSSKSLWWTHSVEDVKQCLALLKKELNSKRTKLLLSIGIPERQKQLQLQMLQAAINSNVPRDPLGNPLMETHLPLKWIEVAEKSPEHFGEHGLETFMQAHHRNCKGKVFKLWKDYEQLLETIK